MSISLIWRVRYPTDQRLKTNAPSRLLEVLAEAFGDVPKLDPSSIPVLKALAKAMPEEGAFRTLIDAIEAHEEIEVVVTS